MRSLKLAAGVAAMMAVLPASADPVVPPTPEPITIRRAAGPITVDGRLDDPGWLGAARIERFYEVSPADNVQPKVRTVALLAYDDRYVYVGLVCDDPRPARIHAPYVSRDEIISTEDFVAVYLDTRGDRRSALEFRVDARGQQADGIYDDGSGNDDLSPDFFYDTAAVITPRGWQAEMRIPFSTLRYDHRKPLEWGILVWRNYPRDFLYAIYSSPIPRNSNCGVCHALPIKGLEGLPAGGRLIVAPYGDFSEQGMPREGPGSRFLNGPVDANGGVDAKWMPNADTALDASVNPDFSQVESDVGQIGINRQFAIFYPEKRPLFLEGTDLFQTPIQAVYTRTITSPRWGARATGKLEDTAYTVLVAEDRGGGSVVVPGETASTLAPQDFSSIAAIGRVRQDFGASFGGLLFTDREIASNGGGGHNRVIGPDVLWRISDRDLVLAQFLYSDTQTPDRPDLDPTWTGRRFSSHAIWAQYQHSGYHWLLRFTHDEYGEGFRAYDGFVPQVGYRFDKVVIGYSVYNVGIFSQLTGGPFCNVADTSDGSTLQRQCGVFISPSGIHNLSGEIDLVPHEKERVGDTVVDSHFTVYYNLSIDPGLVFSRISASGFVGDYRDIANARPGHGADVALTGTVWPTDHLALDFNAEREWLDVEAGGRSGRLFTADFARLKGTYNFTPHAFLRLIGQYITARQDPTLYLQPVAGLNRDLTGSALFAYTLNWQTVFYLGYGDSRALNAHDALVPAGRQFFLKVSYAFEH
jgi:Domain of unknown function (DUF5916)